MAVRAWLVVPLPLVVEVVGCGPARAPSPRPTVPRTEVAASKPPPRPVPTRKSPPRPSPPRAASKPKPRPPTARPSRSAALRFELRGREFPLPVVRGTVAGQPTWMLVDTGANSHVIASWLAKKAGLPMQPLGDVGSDHSGRPVYAYAVDDPKVAIEGWGALEKGPMLVTDVPEPIERLGIGAFISPQWLGREDEAVVVDLSGRTMHTARFDDAVKALGNKGTPLPEHVRVCEDSSSVIKGLAFVLPATVDGHAANLLVDTGAHKTDLLTTSRAGQKLVARSVPNKERMYAAAGLVRTRTVKEAHVRVGSWSMKADVDLIPGVADPVCPRDGVVSMDLLKRCVLVMGRKKLVGRCAD